MTWLQRYRLRHFVRNSIWIAPVVGMAVTLAAVRGLAWFDHEMGWDRGQDPDAARAVLGTLAASMFTFIVFVSSALLVVFQLASAQLSPRVIGIVFRDPVTRGALTVFVVTFTATLAVLVRITTTVPMLTAQLTAYGCLVSLGAFLYLIDHVGRQLRPSGILRAVGRLGRGVIDAVYPRPVGAAPAGPLTPAPGADGKPPVVVPSPGDGVVQAFDVRGLAALAERADCVVELVPQVGDAVAEGDPLFRVTGGGAAGVVAALHQSVALGQERTVEQDPRFVFRILVDIAAKGLSPAINDPTTAVLAIDQVHRLLRVVGNRWLDEGQVRDAAGRVRLVYRTPDWEDFVQLAVTEIRQFGGSSIQVARRLRAMLLNLTQTLPADRVEPLRRELKVLHDTAQRTFFEPEDRVLADVGDAQGVGASHGSGPRAGSPDAGSRPVPQAASSPACAAVIHRRAP
ncbi:MAG TPA: DUF2254 domain-containing protein [Gemmataceae bacterium]|jgi:uncharacterized membrane protein